MIGRLLRKALEQAGVLELGERALSGQGLELRDMAVLEQTDLLLVAGLADAVRRRHRGDEVRVLANASARRDADLLRLHLPGGGADGPTGEELLRQVALARLSTPCTRGVGVSFEQLGLELAQTALAFGADVLFGDLETKRTLPLLSGKAARRQELAGLIERSGRRVRFADETLAAAPLPSAEGPS
jgi:2-iminoacetate synthase ThiH